MPRIGIPKTVRAKGAGVSGVGAGLRQGNKERVRGKAIDRPSTIGYSTGDKDDVDRRHLVHKQGKVRMCADCQALSREKRWYYDKDETKKLLKTPELIDNTLCPGCAGIRSKLIGGFMELKGEWDKQQKQDLLNLIRRVADSSQKRNPAHRLIRLEDRKDMVYVETTTNRLAENIGREIHKAFHGELTMQWPKMDLVVRVFYERKVPQPAESKAKGKR